jgi:exodeoxyribonuclease-1
MSNQKTLLWYDCETTGLSGAFDQVVQFAALRTTVDFEMLEQHNILVQLNSDTVPSPQAMGTHQIPLQTLASGLKEYDAICKIHQLFNTPNTVTVGYNTLGFDDEFLRFNFFRNLLPPYQHQYANGCGRMDIFPMMACCKLFMPEIMVWPRRENGQPSLKLEDLATANHLQTGQAHDALSDVLMTRNIAQHLATQAPEMWRYLCDFFNKATAQSRVQQLPLLFDNAPPYRLGLLLDPRFGHRHHYLSPAIYLGNHHHYKNQQLWLRLDIENFHQYCADPDTRFRVIHNAKPGEAPFALPAKSRYLAHLEEDQMDRFQQQWQYFTQHPGELDVIREQISQQTHPTIERLDANAALYQHGFWNPQETAFCQQFHQTDWKHRASLLQRCDSKLLKTLALRLIGRHDFDLLDSSQQHDFKTYLHEVWCSPESHRDHKNRYRHNPQHAEPLDNHQNTHAQNAAHYINEQSKLHQSN